MKPSELIKLLEQTIEKHGDKMILMEDDHWDLVETQLVECHSLGDREGEPLFLTFQANDESEFTMNSVSYSVKVVESEK